MKLTTFELYALRFTILLSIGIFSFVVNPFQSTPLAAANSISGTLTDINLTPVATPQTVTLVIGTSTPSVHSTTTATTTGAFTFNVTISSVPTSTPLIVYLDDNNVNVQAVTVTKKHGTSTISNLSLMQGRLSVSHEASSGTTTRNTDLDTYDNGNDTDIPYTVTGGVLTVARGTDLYVAPNKTFAPGGAVYASSSVTIGTGATYTAPVSTTINGIFANNGTFTENGGTLTMDGIYQDALSYVAGRDSSGSAGGTGNLTINTLTTVGNFLYVGKSANGTGCLQTAGSADGCELMVFDISSTTNPIYVAGRDISGSAGGTGSTGIWSMTTVGNFLYVGGNGNGTGCLQTAGSAIGCELQVYDISSTTNPIYVAGRDSSGSAGGTGNVGIYSMTTVGNFLYVGKNSDFTSNPCSQTAGSAISCELMVFDISSSTNPIYVAGRDADGSAGGTGAIRIFTLTTVGSFLYVGKQGVTTACSQTAGSAIGCELMVFDISSSTNPIYVAGRDASGDAGGTGSADLNTIRIAGNYLYAGKTGGFTACSQTAGSAIGCELQVYDISSTTNPIYVAGRDSSGSAAGTGGGGVYPLTIVGKYLYIGKYYDASVVCSQIAGTSGADACHLIVFDISSSTNPIYVAGRNSSGSADGNFSGRFTSILGFGDKIYVGRVNDFTACSQTAGTLGAKSCELVVFSTGLSDVSATLGLLTDSSALGNVVTKNIFSFKSNASTTDLNIVSGTTTLRDTITATGNFTNNAIVVVPDNSIQFFSGNYYNSGTIDYGSINTNTSQVFHSNAPQNISGTLTETNAFNNLSFSGSGVKTVADQVLTQNLDVLSGSNVDFKLPLTVSGNLLNLGTVTAPDTLSIFGNYTNQGTFNSGGGLLEVKTTISDFVAGRDSSGSAGGTINFQSLNSIFVSGNYMYIGQWTDYTGNTCSQIAGSAESCELMVYDISSSTNPIYVAGRDASGSAGGTGSVEINALTIVGNYLYVGKGSSNTACSQAAGSAIGCEIMVFDISSSTNPIYVAGRDASGDAGGSASVNIYGKMTTAGNFLYVGKLGSTTACSQTAGSAIGCEIMVFDISSTTNPIYVAGRDVSGSAGGTASAGIYFMTTRGNSLYVGTQGSTTPCSQVIGFAIGCELMVFDISSSTNPIYVAGRDASGSAGGTGSVEINALTIVGNYLYVGKGSSNTACSQAAGSAIGCEIMVFDISSSTNPIYVAGRDASGSENGFASTGIYSMTISGNHLYVGKDGNSTACSQTAGSARGCELMIFDTAGKLSGTLTGSSALNNVVVSGRAARFVDAARVKDLSVSASSSLTLSNDITLTGDFTQLGTLTPGTGTTTFAGITTQTATGTLTFNHLYINTNATTTFGSRLSTAGNLTATSGAKILLTPNGTSTITGNLKLSGTVSAPITFRSSQNGVAVNTVLLGTSTASYTTIKDSRACGSTGGAINVSSGNNTDGGNTECWSFVSSAPAVYIGENLTFYSGQATTTLPTITLTDAAVPAITAAGDIRLTIATSTTNFRFDTTISSLTLGGTASSKVANPVTYQNGGATAIIAVNQNFAAGETLTIGGLKVGSFGLASPTASRLGLYTTGNSTGTPTSLSAETIRLNGALTIAEHTLGQATNKFGLANRDDETFFAFRLEPAGETVTITDTVITLSGAQDITTTNILDMRLYRDVNNDGAFDGGDALIGTGITTVNGQFGAITVNDDIVISTATNYILIGDTFSLQRSSAIGFSIEESGLTTLGSTSLVPVTVIENYTKAKHLRSGGSGGGASVGRSAVQGSGVVTGGEAGGGGGIGEGVDGANIANDPDYARPTQTGLPDNQWTTPANALVSDGVYATAASAGFNQSFSNFNFNIPNNNTIQGIAIKLDASGSTANGTIDVGLSWDGGTSYTTGKATPTLSGSDIVYTVGDATDTWGRTWTPAELSSSLFRVRVTAQPNNNTVRLDALEVRIYHQAGGGGSGGGGRL